MNKAIEQAKQAVNTAKDRLLKTFSFVPNDKLNWSPSPTAKNALRIAAHAAVGNYANASLIRGEKLKTTSPSEMMAFVYAEEKKVTSRDQAVKLIEDSCKTVLAALDGLTEQKMATSVASPFGTFPMMFWMNFPSSHMEYCAAQIDYLQTIWGDLEIHM